MASTTGGFFLGIGVCVLLLSLGGTTLLQSYSSELATAKTYSSQLYHTTHSYEYQKIMNALDYLGDKANLLADKIGWLSGDAANALRKIPQAADKMEDIYYSSEKIYSAMQITVVAPQYLTYGAIIGGLLILTGIVLIIRARKLNSKPLRT